MTERSTKVRDLFLSALELPEAERGQFLATNVAGDLDLRREIEGLLAAAPAAGFLDPPEVRSILQLTRPTHFGPSRVEAPLEAAANRWLARHPTSQRLVRIEVHALAAESTPDRLGQFARQAHAPERLGATPCVRVHEHGQCALGIWVAMDHIDGHSLAIERDHQQRPAELGPGLLPASSTPAWLEAVRARLAVLAQTLAAAHAVGIVHGALGADRVLLDRSGRTFLCGFGDAALHGHAPAGPAADLAAVGRLLGDLLEVGYGEGSSQSSSLGQALLAVVERSASAGSGGYRTMAALAADLARAGGAQQPAPMGLASTLRRWFGRA